VEQTLIELTDSFAVVVGAIRSALPDQESAQVHSVDAADPLTVVQPMPRISYLRLGPCCPKC
jgi:hypothetical protein